MTGLGCPVMTVVSLFVWHVCGTTACSPLRPDDARRRWTSSRCRRILVDVDEPERGWRPGDYILVDLPDGQTVRCRVVNVKDDGTIQVVPEHPVVTG
jgi:hypothetical protein